MDFNDLYSEYFSKLNSLGLKGSERCLLADIDKQEIAHFHQGKSEKVYPMSSSRQPPSCKENSLGTPWGLHVVCQKIGDDQKKNMVFEGRIPIGFTALECSLEKQKRNLITSRILRLDGLEIGVNSGGEVDTYSRYVYIHGTNHERNIGEPASSGCLQLKNDDVIELFEKISVGTHLYIQRK
jgi:hypothetical protein